MDAVAVAEANVADSNEGRQDQGHPEVNGEPGNRFQKAIAAWRSMSMGA